MSSTSIARQNRRMRHRQLPALNSSLTILTSNNSKANLPDEVSTDCSEEKSSIQPELSTTGCSFVNCDVSSRPIGKVFVEDERGFRIIDVNQMQTISNEFMPPESLKEESAIIMAYKAALIFQNISHFCHGLLGGMSLIHLLLLIHLITTESSKSETIKHFSFLSQPIHNIFNFVCMICCISAFDRFDIANLKNLFSSVRKCQLNVCIVIAYPISLLMSLSTMNVDEKLWLPSTNFTQWEAALTNDATNELFYWKILSILKCAGAVLAWILLCLDPNQNFFLQYLKDICTRSTHA